MRTTILTLAFVLLSSLYVFGQLPQQKLNESVDKAAREFMQCWGYQFLPDLPWYSNGYSLSYQ